MVKFYNNLSPATKLLIQSFLAVLGAAIAGGVTAAYQSYLTSNQLNLQVLVNVSLLTFSLLFGKAMHDWIPAHAQQLLQAANDEKAALYNALQQAQQTPSAVIATQGRLVQSTSPQSQQQPVAIIQAPALIKSEDIQAISQQLALNLMNMSKPPAMAQAQVPVSAPAEEPYEDPLKVSMKLPVYTSPAITGIADLATQAQFQVPPRPQSVIMP